MKPFTRKILQLASAFLLSACMAMPNLNAPTDDGVGFQITSNRFVSDYILQVQDQFKIQSVNAEHQSDVDAAVRSFEEDLAAAQLADYYQSPDFTIKLAAGSEGSALSAGSEGSALSAGSEGSALNGETLSQRGAVYAQAVVFNDNLPQAEVYKGQFFEGRFYFDQKQSQNISPLNTTYLITLDVNLETEIFQGQLSAGSEGSALSAGSEGSALSAGSEGSALNSEAQSTLNEAQLAANQEKYAAALSAYFNLNEEYEKEVRELKFIPPFDPVEFNYTETLPRLARAYEQELKLTGASLRGLPTPVFYLELKNAIERLSRRWEHNCGAPPPDSGERYPQRTPEFTAVLIGFQSPELDSVIADIPELKGALDEKLKEPPPRRWKDNQDFLDFLLEYKAQYPEVFEKHQWQDKFAPPACVKSPNAQNLRLPNRPSPPGEGPEQNPEQNPQRN